MNKSWEYSTESELLQKERELTDQGYRRIYDFSVLTPGQYRLNMISTRENSFEKTPTRWCIEWVETT